ncbi:thioesterase II family protein [Streptomyces chrestomyceticus]|uniref:thioesterase II family protein n=1 Tax=Streptomyces chrestomyceticus TaxID=68185 RepID=UPI00379CBEA2
MPDRLLAETPFIRRARRMNRKVRLFCFPHAGAGASAFAAWPDLFPPEVEIVAVQLPGREDRVGEAHPASVDIAVRMVAVALRPYLQGPYAFFGHSGGALLAFELARALRKRGTQPGHLFLSGQPAPGHDIAAPELHRLSDEDFSAALRGLDGTSDGVFADPGLMKLLLPTLRADFTLWESHRHRPDQPLAVPITALGGDTDPRAPVDGLQAWRQETTGAFSAEVFPGGHFYLNDSGAELAAVLAGTLLGQESTYAGQGERTR